MPGGDPECTKIMYEVNFGRPVCGRPICLLRFLASQQLHILRLAGLNCSLTRHHKYKLLISHYSMVLLTSLKSINTTTTSRDSFSTMSGPFRPDVLGRSSKCERNPQQSSSLAVPSLVQPSLFCNCGLTILQFRQRL